MMTRMQPSRNEPDSWEDRIFMACAEDAPLFSAKSNLLSIGRGRLRVSRQVFLLRAFAKNNYHPMSEIFQSHCGDVREPGDRAGEQNSVASAGGFQMVQKDDAGQYGCDGAEHV